MKKSAGFFSSLSLTPLALALSLCALFCLPRIIIPGTHPAPRPHLILIIPAEGLTAEQIRTTIEALVVEELEKTGDRIELTPHSHLSEFLLSVQFPFCMSETRCISTLRGAVTRVRNRFPYQAGEPTIFPLSETPAFLNCIVHFQRPPEMPEIRPSFS